MATRIEWLDDPNAPAVNNIIPAASVVVANDQGEILLHRAGRQRQLDDPRRRHGVRRVADPDRHPGGQGRDRLRHRGHRPGRDLHQPEPPHRVHQQRRGPPGVLGRSTSAEPVGGEPTLNDEATRIEWVPPDKLDELQMADPIRQRIARYLEGDAEPYLG